MTLRTWDRPHFKSDEPSRVDRRRARKAQEEQEWRECCKVVDARDKKRCRYCGKRGHPDAVGLLDRIHRHHYPKRSVGGTHDPRCVISLCSPCHDEADRHKLDVRGDANQGVEFWVMGREGYYLEARESAPHQRVRD